MENDINKSNDLLYAKSSEIKKTKSNRYLLSREEFIKINNYKKSDD